MKQELEGSITKQLATDQDAIAAFFTRNGMMPRTRQRCDNFAQSHFPSAVSAASGFQGYCSYTMRISDSHLLQFRPASFQLDVAICGEAKRQFHGLAPETEFLGVIEGILKGSGDSFAHKHLYVYQLERMRGVTLTQFRATMRSRGRSASAAAATARKLLIEDVARLYATSFRHGRHQRIVGGESQPMQGRVGASLESRIDLLQELAEPDLRRQVQKIRENIGRLAQDMPWCLTHGDAVPTNVMVDTTTGQLVGLIDWAEGEWLPFGVGLYGLEEMLGEESSDGRGVFAYYTDHEELRHAFWYTFLAHAGLAPWVFSSQWMQDVRLCRKLGILLWRGIAFDNGQLDRVVDLERDATELQKLRLFLSAPEPPMTLGWRLKILMLMSWARQLVRGHAQAIFHRLRANLPWHQQLVSSHTDAASTAACEEARLSGTSRLSHEFRKPAVSWVGEASFLDAHM
jgi:hypothetical protein